MKNKLLTTAVALSAISSVQAFEKNTLATHVPGEVIVKLKSGMAKSFLSRKNLYSADVKEVMNLTMGEVAVLRVPQTKSLKSVIAQIAKDDAVEYVEPNFIYKAIDSVETLESKLYNARTPNYISNLTSDPKFGDLWGLVNTGNNEPAGSRGNSAPSGIAGVDVNAINAWSITKGSKNVKIAVIDTGVDYNHPDLKANIWTNTAEANGKPGVDDDGNGYVDDIHGYDFANNDGDPMDGNGHGTHCSGTIAAEHDNGVGIAGVMAQAQIVGIKFLTDQGSGSTADAIKAIDYATKINVDIMSNSWGGGGFSQVLKDSIVAAKNAGIVFTAAAGNSATDNNSQPHYPSNYDVDNVISVAANNYNDELAFFSCYGSKTVHVAAPGRNILSTTPNNSYDVYSGTSMATPHVTGVVGLYISQYGRTDVKQLRDNLMKSSIYARSYGRKTIGKGRVDAYNFLMGVTASRPAEPNPNDWVAQAESYESAHPYANGAATSKKFSVPGAKFIRVKFAKYDMEENYDFVVIKDAAGNEVEKISGAGVDYESEYVEGDTVEVSLTSDASINKWGFQVSEIQVIY